MGLGVLRAVMDLTVEDRPASALTLKETRVPVAEGQAWAERMPWEPKAEALERLSWEL